MQVTLLVRDVLCLKMIIKGPPIELTKGGPSILLNIIMTIVIT